MRCRARWCLAQPPGTTLGLRVCKIQNRRWATIETSCFPSSDVSRYSTPFSSLTRHDLTLQAAALSGIASLLAVANLGKGEAYITADSLIVSMWRCTRRRIDLNIGDLGPIGLELECSFRLTRSGSARFCGFTIAPSCLIPVPILRSAQPSIIFISIAFVV